MMTTLHLSSLEKAMLDYFHQLYESNGFPPVSAIRVLQRKNTGGGRYVDLESNQKVQLDDGYIDLGGRFIEMKGIPNGMMAVVLVKDGRVRFLELAVYGGYFWNGDEREWKIV
jgi:hypothetical protein